MLVKIGNLDVSALKLMNGKIQILLTITSPNSEQVSAVVPYGELEAAIEAVEKVAY